jgi:uncharacterized small protein (DUF1192 family)
MSGDAKTKYQREYMRKRRAGAKAEPKAARSHVAQLEQQISELQAEVTRLRAELKTARAASRRSTR